MMSVHWVKADMRASQAHGGGWSNLWRLSAPDRWGSFTRKKFDLKAKSPPELRVISQSANLSISSGCGGLFRAASIRVELAAVALMNVRCWGKSRRHLLSRSFSAFDPQRTSALEATGAMTCVTISHAVVMIISGVPRV